MKIISYNINGIRAAIKKGFIDWLKLESPDVLCLQEIKAMENQFKIHRKLIENQWKIIRKLPEFTESYRCPG